MNVHWFEPPVNVEENAVSALLQLETNCHLLAYYRRINVPASCWPARFFVLKLIHELEHLIAEEKDPAFRHKLGLTCSTACMTRTALDKIHLHPHCYSPKVEEYLSHLEAFVVYVRGHMEPLIDRYPGITEPFFNYEIVASESAE